MGALQPMHWIIVLVVIILLFGGTKIPELMRGVGKGMGEFNKGLKEGRETDEDKARAIEMRKKALAEEQARLEAEEAELRKK